MENQTLGRYLSLEFHFVFCWSHTQNTHTKLKDSWQRWGFFCYWKWVFVPFKQIITVSFKKITNKYELDLTSDQFHYPVVQLAFQVRRGFPRCLQVVNLYVLGDLFSFMGTLRRNCPSLLNWCCLFLRAFSQWHSGSFLSIVLNELLFHLIWICLQIVEVLLLLLFHFHFSSLRLVSYNPPLLVSILLTVLLLHVSGLICTLFCWVFHRTRLLISFCFYSLLIFWIEWPFISFLFYSSSSSSNFFFFFLQ